MKKITLLFLSLIFTTACHEQVQAPTPKDAPSCTSACFRMKVLDCPEGKDVLDSEGKMISCKDWCEYSIETLKIPFNPSCISNINQCSQIETTCAVGEVRK